MCDICIDFRKIKAFLRQKSLNILFKKFELINETTFCVQYRYHLFFSFLILKREYNSPNFVS